MAGGCGCGGSRQKALDRQRQQAESRRQTRDEALAAADHNPGGGMYWQPPVRQPAKTEA